MVISFAQSTSGVALVFVCFGMLSCLVVVSCQLSDVCYIRRKACMLNPRIQVVERG